VYTDPILHRLSKAIDMTLSRLLLVECLSTADMVENAEWRNRTCKRWGW
jgi:hypothetical protein